MSKKQITITINTKGASFAYAPLAEIHSVLISVEKALRVGRSCLLLDSKGEECGFLNIKEVEG